MSCLVGSEMKVTIGRGGFVEFSRVLESTQMILLWDEFTRASGILDLPQGTQLRDEGADWCCDLPIYSVSLEDGTSMTTLVSLEPRFVAVRLFVMGIVNSCPVVVS